MLYEEDLDSYESAARTNKTRARPEPTPAPPKPNASAINSTGKWVATCNYQVVVASQLCIPTGMEQPLLITPYTPNQHLRGLGAVAPVL
jgi:hypothetical protein